MVSWCIMQQIIACTSEHLDPQCSLHAYD